jgi:hypothetical protein
MLNKGGNHKYFVEGGRLPILACGRSIKNSVSEYSKEQRKEIFPIQDIFDLIFILEK